MGDWTNLVCLTAFDEASRDLENARCRCCKAGAALMACRAALEPVVGRAYQEQSFGSINTLFREEEAALAVFERARSELAAAEERWWTMKAALDYEKRFMTAGAVSGIRLN
jgi:uncharacterized protein YifE (UPF0438 family)